VPSRIGKLVYAKRKARSGANELARTKYLIPSARPVGRISVSLFMLILDLPQNIIDKINYNQK